MRKSFPGPGRFDSSGIRPTQRGSDASYGPSITITLSRHEPVSNQPDAKTVGCEELHTLLRKRILVVQRNWSDLWGTRFDPDPGSPRLAEVRVQVSGS